MATTIDKIHTPAAEKARKVHIEAPAQWLYRGWQDLKAAPVVSLIYGSIFVATGYSLVIGLLLADMAHFILPLMGGFVLFGPWLALGLYEVVRQRELGMTPSFLSTWQAWRIHPRRFGLMAMILLGIMLFWIRVATLIYALILGNAAFGLDQLTLDILTSQQGLIFLTVGSTIGLAFAAFVFMLTAISLPMLMDKDVDVFDAVSTSIETVMKNSHVMWSWAFTIGILTWFGMLTFFVGLIVIMPILGYATWHAYRDMVPQNKRLAQ